LNDWLVSRPGGIFVFLLFLFVIGLTNLRFLHRMERYGAPARFPHVAVLVPARNEAANIGDCIRSLLAQDYANFEIIALDDHSSDRTGAVLAELAAADPRLRALAGQPLPPGWLGKHWACHQLVQATDAELILFTDADTRHHPHALRNAVSALLREEAALITALPREHVVTWGEKLIVPLLPWSVFYFLPLGLAHRMAFPPLSATIGQFMLFRRAAYEAIGGHAAVRRHAADDLALGRHIIAHDFRWRLVDGVDAVECRMYRNWREAFDGFGKNLFAAFDYIPWLFVPIWLWLGIVFLAPLLVALSGNVYAGGPPVALSLVLWAMFYRRFHFPLYLTTLYPLTVTIAVLLAFRSMALTVTGRAVWKGRVLTPGTDAELGQ
jgi:chlorobactene glucosyltransferase